MAATNTIAAGIMDAMVFAFMGPGSFGCPHVACTWPLISASPSPAALGCSMALVCNENLLWPGPGPGPNCNAGSGTGFGSGLSSHCFGSGPRPGPDPGRSGAEFVPPPPRQPVSVLRNCFQPHVSFPTIPAPIIYFLPSCTINQIIRSERFTHLSSSICHHPSSPIVH